MRLPALVAVFGLVGCGFHSGFDNTRYQCGLGDVCPSGYECVAGYCELGSPPDATVVDADPLAPDADLTAPDATPDAAVAAAGCGTLALLVDDFATSTRSALWTRFADTNATLTQANGSLKIALAAGSGDFWGGYDSAYAYDLTSSQISTTVAQTGGINTVLEIWNRTGGKAQVAVMNGMIGAVVLGVPGAGARGQVPYVPATHRHWRIREASGTMYWETSPNGSAWTELWHEALPFAVEHVRGRLAAGGLLAAASEARFDEVNLGAPAVPGLCGGQTLVDDFTALGPRWTAWADPGCTVSIVTGELVLASSGTSENYCGLDSEHLYDLTAGPIYADATAIASGSNHVSFFQAVAPGDSNTRIEIDRDQDTMQYQQWIGGTLTTDVQLPYMATDRYWRLRVNGTTVNLGTSPDGVVFTDRTNSTLGFDATKVHIVVAAGHYAAGAAVTAKYRGINTP